MPYCSNFRIITAFLGISELFCFLCTVEPVYKDRPWENRKLVFVHRWSLFGGSVSETHYIIRASLIRIWFPDMYRNVPKFSDRQVLANSADTDQTAPRGAV